MLNYVTLIVDLADGTGSPIAQGFARLAPSVTLADAQDQLVVVQAPVQAAFGRTFPPAFPSVKVLATDDVNIAPVGWQWTISFPGVPGNPAGFSFSLPYSAGATQYLSSLAPAPGSIAVTLFDLDGGRAADVLVAAGVYDGGPASGGISPGLIDGGSANG